MPRKTTPTEAYPLECTGKVVPGDQIRWSEPVFTGPYQRPVYGGTRTIEAGVVKASYGGAGGQVTFTLEVLAAKGYQAPPIGKRLFRKAETLFRNRAYRALWREEAHRDVAVVEQAARAGSALEG